MIYVGECFGQVGSTPPSHQGSPERNIHISKKIMSVNPTVQLTSSHLVSFQIFLMHIYTYRASLVSHTVENLYEGDLGFDPSVGNIPWRREWQPTPVFLSRESHGQRKLVGYSLWCCKKLDMTEPLIHTHTHTHTHV